LAVAGVLAIHGVAAGQPACTVVQNDIYQLVAAANADPDPSCIDLNGQTIALNQGVLRIDSDLTILGGGGKLDAHHRTRAIEVTGNGRLILQDVTVANGRPPANDPDYSTGACMLVRTGGVATLTGVTLTYCRFERKHVEGQGGALYNAGTTTIAHSTLWLNSAFEGGGIFNASPGSLLVTATTFFSNRIAGNGGAKAYIDAERFGGGGGLSNHGTARVEASDFNLNKARLGQGGGALLNYQDLVVVNSLFFHNRARRTAGGFLRNHGTTRLAFVTAGPNQGRSLSGNISNGENGTVYATHTVVFLDRTTGPGTANCSGPPPIAQGYNFEAFGDDQCGFEIESSTPAFAPYRNYGGPTLTRPPKSGSPLINAGSPGPCQFESAPGVIETVEVDQRGLPRPVDRCDIGAVEIQPGEAF